MTIIVYMDEISFLQAHSLFGGLTDEEVGKILPLMEEEVYSGGDVILREGNINDKLYFIYKGSVEVLKYVEKGGRGEEKRLNVLHTGDTFGEMEIIDIQPCEATVKALESTTVLVISNKNLYKISKMNLKTYTLIIMNLARDISRRLRMMDRELIRGIYSI